MQLRYRLLDLHDWAQEMAVQDSPSPRHKTNQRQKSKIAREFGGNLSTGSSRHQQFWGDRVELDDFDGATVRVIARDQWCVRIRENGINVPDIQVSIVHCSSNHASRFIRRGISPGKTIEPNA